MTSSGTPQTAMVEKAKKAGLARWTLETLTGLLGIKALQHHEAETEKNVSAENAHVRKTIWGSSEVADENHDMGNGGNIVLGDVQHPTPIVISGQQSGGNDFLKGLAIAALGAAIPGAGIAGYLVNQAMSKPTPIAQPATPAFSDQNDFSVGLGKIEDYLKQD